MTGGGLCMKNTKNKAIYKLRPKGLSFTAPAKETGYEKDFFKWATRQAKYLNDREFSKLDIENLIEEIEDLSKRERDKLVSYLENLLMHQLKVKYQPKMHTASWDASIKEATFKVHKVLEKNPSLKPRLKEILHEAYYTARLRAVRETGLEEETFPEKCPWSLKDVFPHLEKKYC